MKPTAYQRRLRDAVEARETLDRPEFARLAMQAGQCDEWRREVQLDQAISAWRQQQRKAGLRQTVRQQAMTIAAATALGLGGLWLMQPVEPVLTAGPAIAEQVSYEEPTDRGRLVAARPLDSSHRSQPVAAPRPDELDRFAQASVTAERLAYAIQPVGEQVGSMVRLLFDAVPGTDVLAM